VAHYILNSVSGETAAREQATELMRAGMWSIDDVEPHRGALAAGDRVLVYLGAPAREFVGRAEVASAVRAGGLALAQVEEWDPPVSMSVVLSRLGPSAKADFDVRVVPITAHEYETVLAVAAERAPSTG